MESVVLVDEEDNEIGRGEKLATHLKGQLHRAISVFLFNEDGQLMVQQRALSKYHSGGLWSNTCCGHPRPGEKPIEAAKRRLWEEMGIHCEMEKIFDFVYKVSLDNLTEHEFDHVFVGRFDGDANPNPEEAHAWKWIDVDELSCEMRDHPQRYTYWFKIVLERVLLTQFARPT